MIKLIHNSLLKLIASFKQRMNIRAVYVINYFINYYFIKYY